MKQILILTSIVLFLFLFSINAYAYLPIDINNSVSLANNVRGIRCINSTADNKIYCYVLADKIIYRFNETLQDQKSCNLNYTLGNHYGLSVLNNTDAYISSGSAYCDYWDITNIATGTCTLKARYGYALYPNGCYAKSPFTYQSGSFSNNAFYIPNYAVTNLTFASIESPFWPTPSSSNSIGTVSIPNRSDNTTIYITGISTTQKPTYKYVSGALSKTLGTFSEYWNIGSSNHVDIDLFKHSNSLTYGFIVADNGVDSDFLYRVNFTQAENTYATVIFALSPLNNSYDVNTADFPLRLELSTQLSGTLYFYFDNAFAGSINVNQSNINDGVFSYTANIPTTSSHSWRASYIDNQTNTWSFGNIYFTAIYGGLSPDAFFERPADTIALLFASPFNITDLPTARNLASMILTFIFSMIITLLVAIYGKVKGNFLFYIYIISFIGLLIMFTITGWFDVIYMVLLSIICGVIIVKALNIFGG